ncbi:Tuberous sclerosis 2-like protein, partial [Pichia californica]
MFLNTDNNNSQSSNDTDTDNNNNSNNTNNNQSNIESGLNEQEQSSIVDEILEKFKVDDTESIWNDNNEINIGFDFTDEESDLKDWMESNNSNNLFSESFNNNNNNNNLLSQEQNSSILLSDSTVDPSKLSNSTLLSQEKTLSSIVMTNNAFNFDPYNFELDEIFNDSYKNIQYPDQPQEQEQEQEQGQDQEQEQEQEKQNDLKLNEKSTLRNQLLTPPSSETSNNSHSNQIHNSNFGTYNNPIFFIDDGTEIQIDL